MEASPSPVAHSAPPATADDASPKPPLSPDAPAPSVDPPADTAESTVALQPFGQGPRFSVLMAAYNRADLIHTAIDSVLAQDFDDFELVIVDDGSTDATPEVVRGYPDPRIRYFQKPENEGRAPTRNRAVAEARGEFVLWMADDDLIAPGVLTLYDRVLREHPGVDVVYGNLQLFDHDTGADIEVFEPNDWTGRDDELVGGELYGSCVPDGGTVTRREVYARVDHGPYDDEFVRAQDYELWTRIVGKARFRKIDQIVYRYRKHAGGTSWGQFVDLSYESKIIRRHVARHSLPTLFPKFDWRNRSAEAAARLHIARNLRRYEDPDNAARFVEAIDGVYLEAEMASTLFWTKLGTGDLDRASEVLDQFRAHQVRPHVLAKALQRALDDARALRSQGQAALAAGDAAGADRQAVAFLKEHDLTYDVCLIRGRAHELIGERETALQHYCKAARLRPRETEAYGRAKTLAEVLGLVGPKTDIDAMRRRLGERFVTLPTPTTAARVGPKVSVVLINDDPAAVDDALSSVLGQDYAPLEVIIVGADPETRDSRVRVVAADNESRGAAFNTGWRAATGAVVLWLDSGARFYPGHVGRMVDALGEEGHLAIALGHYVQLEEGCTAQAIRPPFSAFDRTQLLAADAYPLPAVGLRRAAEDVAPFDETVHHTAWDLLLRLSESHEPINADHLGYAVPLKADPVFENRPDIDYVRRLQRIYRRYQRDAVFDVTAREVQGARLRRLGVGQPVHGRTTVIVRVGDDLTRLQGFVAQLEAHTWVPYEVVLVAHQVDWETQTWVRAQADGRDDVTACVYSGALTTAKAINLGIARANGDLVALARDDAALGDGWLGRLQYHLLENPRAGVVMPASWHVGEAEMESAVTARWGETRPATRLDDRCLVLNRDVLERIGGVDVALGADGYEWDDFAVRLALAGFAPIVAHDVPVGGAVRRPDPDGPSARRFARRWGALPNGESLPLPSEAFDKEVHFSPFGAESGFRPDARPVLVMDAARRNLLVFPPWADTTALGALLALLGHSDDRTATWLRAPAGEGEAHARSLGTALAKLGDAGGDPTLMVVDAPLAPDREAGLYLAADAVYVDESWPGIERVIRRTIDCGRPLLRGPEALDRWLTSSS